MLITRSVSNQPGAPTDTTATPARIEDAVALVAEDLVAVERELATLLESAVARIPAIGGHLAFAGGKRLRPLLVLLGAKAAGFEHPHRITVAAVGELMHTATLLHDDVVDGGEFRRGRPSARLEFGNGAAVLTGDYCYARAVQAMARTNHVRAIQSMSDAVTLMAEGEVAQLDIAGNWDITRSEYDMVVERKTAALIAWCSSVAGMPQAVFADALERYGRRVGHAFQIADDVLDYNSGVEKMGKARGQDLAEGKITLPLLMAFEISEGLRRRVQQLLSEGPSVDRAELEAIMDEVARCGALERASEIAEAHARAAIEELSALPASKARDTLAGLAMQVARRTH